MTAALEERLTVEEWDYKIDCERDDCTRTAVVSAKGCADKRHFLRCQVCYQKDIKRIEQWIGDMCNHCHRPILTARTHLDEIWLLGGF